MFRHGVGIHFDVRKLGRVPLEVNLEVSLRGKTTPTHIALKGALTCMRSDMYLQC